jgi:anhydro-N-acetylmuramic acid kinase
MKKSYRVVGVMSGTSMDGLDIAICQFNKNRDWEFKILDATTIRYPRPWRQKLTTAPFLAGDALMSLHAEYGDYIGRRCAEFIGHHNWKNIDFIASHGHTIFHQTKRRFTFQLGEGNAIHAASDIPTVFDFRSFDVALGGQGAPLVPIGDKSLFKPYDVCLNLGGIANLSLDQSGKRIAFDICYANMALNYLAAKTNSEFDRNGNIARRGQINQVLLTSLLSVYRAEKNRPALGREGFEKTFQRLLDNEQLSIEDRMSTVVESIGVQIGNSLPSRKKIKILATGGGALNGFLIQRLQEIFGPHRQVVIPERQIIEFKEALVFAFLGVLRVRGEVNVLKSVTQAQRDSSSGLIAGLIKP